MNLILAMKITKLVESYSGIMAEDLPLDKPLTSNLVFSAWYRESIHSVDQQRSHMRLAEEIHNMLGLYMYTHSRRKLFNMSPFQLTQLGD
jgi:hypothetical protein